LALRVFRALQALLVHQEALAKEEKLAQEDLSAPQAPLEREA